MGNVDEALKLSKRTVSFSTEEILLAVKLLDIMGLEYCISKTESDKVVAHLGNSIPGSICATNDTDVLPHGAPNMLFKTAFSSNHVLLDREELINCLGLTQEQFVRLCIVLGTDYNSGFRQLNWESAIAAVKKHESITDLNLKYWENTIQEQCEDLINIEKIFTDDKNIEFERFNSKEGIDYELFEEEFISMKKFSWKMMRHLKRTFEDIQRLKGQLVLNKENVQIS